jgi:glutaredoxin 1/glutaredoxin 3
MITVYSKDACVYCDKAIALLKVKAKDHVVYKLGKDFDRDTLLEMFPDARSFPVITVDKTFIGGYNELEKLLNSKE